MKPIHIRDYDLLVIGECYVEFRCDGDLSLCNTFDKDIGGADIVTAVTAARLGSGVSLLSAVSRDPFHGMIRERLLAQGINIDHVVTSQGYNGIYFTSSRYPEQREYLVHRPGTAAQSIAPSMIYEDLIENCKIVYASSELQSVSRAARHSVFKAFHFAHSNDIMVAYDPNLRLQRWSLDDAKESLWSVLPLIDVIFPSAPDESKALFGYERPLDVIGFLWDRGVSIVVVKIGANGCMIGYDGKVEEFKQQEHTDTVKDLTLIGSAFNGGFIHCVARGYDPFTAAQFANSVALFKGLKGGGICSLPAAGDLAA
ncbi:MAG: sugar kinase [Fibrobacter sp.]|jgi:2-dehydro-3-deoxygluconokinase|nr:sugar kinase [Fibrobacter sp.]